MKAVSVLKFQISGLLKMRRKFLKILSALFVVLLLAG